MRYFGYASFKGCFVFFVCIWVPVIRVSVACYEDSLRYPVGEPSLDRDPHWVAVEEFEKVGEGKFATSEVVKDDVVLSIISIKPLSAGMHVG